MRYVLDSNVGIKWLLVEDQSDKARAVRDDFIRGVHELLAPDVFLIEASHAFTRAQRQGRITHSEARLFIGDLLTTLPQLSPYPPLLPRAVAISLQQRHNVYDCLYVALAEREGCELLTADDRMIGNLRAAFSFITPLASLS
jgi:predicted nucleic acid-binding protein